MMQHLNELNQVQIRCVFPQIGMLQGTVLYSAPAVVSLPRL